MKYKTRVWLHGLVAAVLNGIGASGVVVMVDPIQFNLFQGGASKLGIVAVASAIFAFFTYLKTHPLPDPEKDTDYTVVTDAAVAKIQGTGDGGTGGGEMPRAIGVLLAIGLSVGALSSCGAKLPPLQPLPSAPAVVEQDVRAFSVHALQIMDAAAQVALDASNIEISFRDQGLVPPPVQLRIDRAFLIFTGKMREAKAAIVAGNVRTWPALKAQLDPVLADLQTVIDVVKGAGPSVWQRVGRGLVTALQLLLAVASPVPV